MAFQPPPQEHRHATTRPPSSSSSPYPAAALASKSPEIDSPRLTACSAKSKCIARRSTRPSRRPKPPSAASRRGGLRFKSERLQISHHLTATNDRLAETDRALARSVNSWAATARWRSLATYTSAQLNGMASRAISTRKGLTAQAATLLSTKDRLERVVTLLETREQAGRDRLDSLKGLLVEIDAKAVAVRQVKGGSGG